jgi:hypothetical protein
MSGAYLWSHPMKRIPLADGGSIVLIDTLHAPSTTPDLEVEHNIYRLDSASHVQWQVLAPSPVRPRMPFTSIYFEGGQLMAYRSDGFEVLINLQTGQGAVGDLIR